MRLLSRYTRTAAEWDAWRLEEETQGILRQMQRLGAKTLAEYIALSCRICQERQRPDNPDHLAPNCGLCRHRHWFAAGYYYGKKNQRCRFTSSRTNGLGRVVLCDHWEPPVPEEEAEKLRLWKRSKAQWESEQSRAIEKGARDR